MIERAVRNRVGQRQRGTEPSSRAAVPVVSGSVSQRRGTGRCRSWTGRSRDGTGGFTSGGGLQRSGTGPL